jgi:hypothetical protein
VCTPAAANLALCVSAELLSSPRGGFCLGSVLLRAPHRQGGVCSILRDSHTLSGVEQGCLLATAGAGGTAEEQARQQLERGGELLRLQPQPACATQNAQETTSGQLS